MIENEQKPTAYSSNPLSFEHHCYTSEEAEQERISLLANEVRFLGLRVERLFDVWMASQNPLSLLGLLLVALGIVGLFAAVFCGWFIVPLALGGGAIGLAFFGICLALELPWQKGTDRQEWGFMQLHPLDSEKLYALTEAADNYPAIKHAITSWLSEGKTIRKRDYDACMDYKQAEYSRCRHWDLQDRLTKLGGAL